jgi:hypothetical protein
MGQAIHYDNERIDDAKGRAHVWRKKQELGVSTGGESYKSVGK